MTDKLIPSDISTIMHGLGQLSGKVEAMHQATTARIDDIRADIKRMEASNNERITQVEARLSEQLKDQGEQLGSVSGGLIAGAIELIKHIGK